MEKYVFVSYSSKDREEVGRLIDEMRRWHIPYWVAPDCILPGSNYAKEIPAAIKNCTVFIPIISANSQESIWVEKEIDMAVSAKKTIFPLQVDSSDLNDMYKFYLNNVQIVSGLDSMDAGIEILLRSVMVKFNEKPPVAVIKEEKEEVKIVNPYTDRANVFRTNRIPGMCVYCANKDIASEGGGAYLCRKCGRYTYDDFRTIRNYLEKNGTSTMIDIVKDTKIPWKNVVSYIDSCID